MRIGKSFPQKRFWKRHRRRLILFVKPLTVFMAIKVHICLHLHQNIKKRPLFGRLPARRMGAARQRFFWMVGPMQLRILFLKCLRDGRMNGRARKLRFDAKVRRMALSISSEGRKKVHCLRMPCPLGWFISWVL